MGPRQDADFRHDRADRLQVAAVDARALGDDVATHDRFLELLEHLADELRRGGVDGAFRSKLRLEVRFGGLDGVVALGLAGDGVSGAELSLGDCLGLGVERRMVRYVDRPRLLGGFLGQLDDRVDDRLEAAVTEHDRAQHDVFAELAGFRFDHEHGIAGAGDDEVELRVGHGIDQRVQHVLAVDVADAGGADRAHEGDTGKGERGGSGDHRHDVGIVLEVVREHGRNHLRFIPIAGGEERADGTIDEARGQRLLLGRPALALEVAARDLAGGEGLFLVVDGEREEIDPRLLLRGADDGGEHRGFAVGGENGTIGLTGEATGLQNKRATRPFDLDTLDVEHGSSFHASLTQI